MKPTTRSINDLTEKKKIKKKIDLMTIASDN